MQKTFIKAGMRIKHPSGVIATTALKELHGLREFNLRTIDFHKEQIRMIDEDIAQVEAFGKKQEDPVLPEKNTLTRPPIIFP